MPVISKQGGRTSANGRSDSDDVLGRAIDIRDLPATMIKMILYGRNRTGKTWLACQFPKPLLLISFAQNEEGGATTAKKVEGVKHIHITRSEDALKLAKQLEHNPVCVLPKQPKWHGKPYQTHVLDDIQALQDTILAEILGLDEVPVQWGSGQAGKEQYIRRAELTKECLRLFYKLTAFNTVATANEKDHNRQESGAGWNVVESGLHQQAFFAADVGSGVCRWLHDYCPYICQLYFDRETVKKTVKAQGKTVVREVETGRDVRRLRTMLTTNYAAGFRSERPQDIPSWIDDPTYAKIAELIAGKP